MPSLKDVWNRFTGNKPETLQASKPLEPLEEIILQSQEQDLVIQMAAEPLLEPEPELIEATPSWEELHPAVDTLVVIADDETYQAQLEARLTEEYLASQGEKTYRCETSNTFRELLKLAFKGNAGQPAKVIFLDDNYNQSLENWNSTQFEDFRQCAAEIGVDVTDIEELIRQVEEKRDIAFDVAFNRLPPNVNKEAAQKDKEFFEKFSRVTKIFERSSSINFALILRLLGFSGEIYALSSTPPMVHEVDAALAEVQEAFVNRPITFPIQGISAKKADYSNKTYYAKEITTSNNGFRSWNIIDVEVERRSEALSQTIPLLLGD